MTDLEKLKTALYAALDAADDAYASYDAARATYAATYRAYTKAKEVCTDDDLPSN